MTKMYAVCVKFDYFGETEHVTKYFTKTKGGYDYYKKTIKEPDCLGAVFAHVCEDEVTGELHMGKPLMTYKP